MASGKIPLTIFSVGQVDKLAQKQAPGERADVLLDLAKSSLQAEQTGHDTFERTPFTDMPWESNGQQVRTYVLAQLTDGMPGGLAIAALLLNSDSSPATRRNALDYLVRQSGDEARGLVLAALGNSYRTVQAHAAELVGQHKLHSAMPALRLLLESPSGHVREAALAAMKQLGFDIPAPGPPPLAAAALQMAATLWQRGFERGRHCQKS